MTHAEHLKEIEKKYMNQTMMPETAWLIARVKKLTEALEELRLKGPLYSRHYVLVTQALEEE